jgi:inner membrane protein
LPSPIAHTLVGGTCYFASRDISKWKKRILLVYIIAASLPDFDFFHLANSSIHFSNIYHRGFSHSILFSIFVFVIVSLFMLIKFNKKTSPYLFIVLVSHSILDYFTFDYPESINGQGVQLFWPLSSAYFISPVTIFRGPETQDLFNLVAWQSAMFDFILLIPLVAVILHQKYFSKDQLKRATVK